MERRQIEDALRASEARLRLVTLQVPAILWSVDKDLTVTFAAGRAMAALGLAPGELDGKPLAQFFGEDQSPMEFIQRALAGEPSLMAGEFRGRWFETRMEPLRDEAGQVVGVLGLSVDQTERHQAEEKLKASEAELRALFASMKDAVVVFDEEGRFLRVLPDRPALLPSTAQDLEGKLLRDTLPEQQSKRLLHAIRRTLASSKPQELDCQIALDGQVRHCSALVSPLSAGRVVCVMRDLTDRVLAEQERARLLAVAEEARQEAERANQAKDQFLATLSHELRTPLASILLRADHLLRASHDPVASKRALEAIRKSARDQAQLIDDLLDVSRIAANKLELRRERVPLAAQVEAAIETVRAAAEEKGLQLEQQVDRDAGVVFGDPGRLQQVVTNLLTNSVKFTPPGGRIRVGLSRHGDQAILQIRDTGVGIAAPELPRVFSRFYQAHRTVTRAKGGLGLGLALVRQLVELHGGTVSAYSPGEGKGATFTVVLPLLGGQPSGIDAPPPRL